LVYFLGKAIDDT
jgi:hypothetical protein